MAVTAHDPLPVTILDARRSATREAMIERCAQRGWRVDVALILADGAPAEACLTPDEFAWLELRVGDIVAVDAIPVLPCSETPAGRSLVTA
ncbi:hypothetical protein DSM104299_02229 [Baekduia alba]|uniref:hypothetical protein n=1 Tax=Baekduia alba TaxID=2997333 RepID=UPI002341C41B|nr:hypothetical protein [Baekduia alba]WCB93516.1 hypothetical protein DSM104299_02229 [Baekduia alba]